MKNNYEESEQELHYLSNVEIPYLYSFTEDKDKKLETLANILLEARKKAIKEFAERLKESIKKSVDDAWHSDGNGIYDAECVFDDIDNLIKEMIGKNNGKV